MELYSAVKKIYSTKFAGKWMYLENIILIKVIKSQRGKKEIMCSPWPITYIHVCVCVIRGWMKSKNMKRRSRQGNAR